jgi:hypothetical protein
VLCVVCCLLCSALWQRPTLPSNQENTDDCVGVVCANEHHVCVDLVQNHACRCPSGMEVWEQSFALQ